MNIQKDIIYYTNNDISDNYCIFKFKGKHYNDYKQSALEQLF